MPDRWTASDGENHRIRKNEGKVSSSELTPIAATIDGLDEMKLSKRLRRLYVLKSEHRDGLSNLKD